MGPGHPNPGAYLLGVTDRSLGGWAGLSVPGNRVQHGDQEIRFCMVRSGGPPLMGTFRDPHDEPPPSTVCGTESFCVCMVAEAGVKGTVFSSGVLKAGDGRESWEN